MSFQERIPRQSITEAQIQKYEQLAREGVTASSLSLNNDGTASVTLKDGTTVTIDRNGNIL